MLASVAKKLQSPRLATLAAQVKLDAFTRVKKAIDDMIVQLLKEKEDEIKHKDFCTDDLNIKKVETERGVQWRPAGGSQSGAAALAGIYLA